MIAFLKKFSLGLAVHIALWFVALWMAFPGILHCGAGRQGQAEVGLDVGANSLSLARMKCGGAGLDAYRPFVDDMVGIYNVGLAGLGLIGVVLFLLRRQGKAESLGLATTCFQVIWPAGAFVWAVAKLFLLTR